MVLVKQCVGGVLVAMAVAGCGAIDPNGATQAGLLGLKALTLSDEEVKSTARAAAKEMDAEATLAPKSNAYAKRLNKVFGKHQNDNGLPLNYAVYLTKDINAFAMADGTVRVYSGLMDAMSDDELRFVIGHEIGHVFHGHSKEKLKTAYATAAARQGVAAAGGTAGRLAAGQLGALGQAVINAQFSQAEEKQADQYGLEFLKRNGYSAKAAPAALRKLGGGGGGFLASHPGSEERAAALEKAM
jgi:metalloprotease